MMASKWNLSARMTAAIPLVVLSAFTPIDPAVADEFDYVLLFRGGGNYSCVPGESMFGGGYTVEAGLPLSDSMGLTASMTGNHVSDGYQLTSSVGWVRLPTQDPHDALAPVSLALLFDQMTDDRVDTVEGSFYTNQIRLQAGYQTTDWLEIGANVSIPIVEDSDVQFRFVNFPNSLPTAGTVDLSASYGIYAAGHRDAWQQALFAGYRELPGTTQLGSSTRYRFNNRVSAQVSATYETRRANWSVWTGFEVTLGPAAHVDHCRARHRRYAACGVAVARSSASGSNPETSIVRRVAYVPPTDDVETTPDPTLGEFPLNLESPTDSEFVPELSVGNWFDQRRSLFSERYVNWDGRLELLRNERDLWMNLNGRGLTDDQQDAIQAPFSGGYAWQKRDGSFGRLDGRRQD